MKKHWSVDEEKMEKGTQEYFIWKLEERINFGIGEGKISKKLLVEYWNNIVIDPFKRKILGRVLNLGYSEKIGN